MARLAVTSNVMGGLTGDAIREKTQMQMPQMQVLEVYHHRSECTHHCLDHGPNQSFFSSVNPERCSEKGKKSHNKVIAE